MKKTLVVIFALAFVLAVSSFAMAQENKLAIFQIDTVLNTAGLQGGSSASGIGPDEYVGFAVYVKNFDQLRAFDLDIKWDSAKAAVGTVMGAMLSSPEILSYETKINGQTITLAADANTLGTVDKSPGEIKEDGHYFVKYAKLGGDAGVSEDYGLIFAFVLKTASTFTSATPLEVEVSVKLDNNAALKKDCGTRSFYVNGGPTGVKSSTWGEIKSQFKDF